MRQERVYGLQLRDACARPNSQRRQPAARTHISSYIPCIYTPRVYRYTLCNSYMSRTIYPYQINPYTRICAKHAKSAHIKSLGLCGCTDFGPWICQSTSLWEKAPILVVYAILCDDTPCVSHQRKYMYMYIYIYIYWIYIYLNSCINICIHIYIKLFEVSRFFDVVWLQSVTAELPELFAREPIQIMSPLQTRCGDLGAYTWMPPYGSLIYSL